MTFFYSWRKTPATPKKSLRRLGNEEIKRQLMDSLAVFNKSINIENLNERANIMQSYESYEEAMDI